MSPNINRTSYTVYPKERDLQTEETYRKQDILVLYVNI